MARLHDDGHGETHRNGPWQTRRGLYAAWLICAALLLFLSLVLPGVLSERAQAQSATLVSNTGQSSDGGSNVGYAAGVVFVWSQQFTTGDDDAGYALTEVVADLGRVGSNAQPEVSIYSESSGAPGSKLYTLSNPASLTSNANNAFTAPADATLEPSTKYYIVFTNGNTANASSAQYNVAVTSSGNEDTGAASGWSIGDKSQFTQSGGSWQEHIQALRIAIQGFSRAATLSDLEISADGSDVPLSPAFSPTVTSYTASIAHRVTEITVLPTVVVDSDMIEYLDGSDMPITDGDGSAEGLQFSPAVGPNTIKVKVTTEDTTTVRTYTVLLTRAVSDDATLSDLEISAGGSDVPLRPGFSPTVTSYIASIENSSTEISVLPTVNDGGATVEYLDANDAAITDGAGAAAGLQFSPAVGRNTIKVKVTAADSVATETYTVVVTRLAQLPPGRALVSNTGKVCDAGLQVGKFRDAVGDAVGVAAQSVHHRWQSRWLHAHASSRRDPKHRVRGPTGGEHLQRIVGGARLEAVHAGEPGFP